MHTTLIVLQISMAVCIECIDSQFVKLPLLS